MTAANETMSTAKETMNTVKGKMSSVAEKVSVKETVNTAKTVASDVQDRAHQVWLAGLGALASAGDEGSKLFTNLVEKGEKVEKQGFDQVDKVKTKMDDTGTKVRGRAEEAWGKVESSMDRVVGGTLQRMGVPSRQEIATLTRRVEELTEAVARLQPKRTTSRKKTTASAAN